MGATVSARRAATLCNVSGTTVQRWIASGRLRASLVDGAYAIDVDDLAPFLERRSATGAGDTVAPGAGATPGDTGATVEGVQPGATADLADLIALVREQAQRLEQYAGQIGYLQAQLQTANDRIALLSAPPAPVGGETVNHPAEVNNGAVRAVQSERLSARRPWWRIWLLW